MLLSKLAFSGGFALLPANLIMTPVDNFYRLVVQSDTKEEVVHKLVEKDYWTYFDNLISNIVDSFTNEFMVLTLGDLILNMIQINDFFVVFSIGSLTGLLSTLCRYPSSHGQMIYNKKEEEGTLSSLETNPTRCLRLLFVEEGLTGVYRGSTLFFISSFLYNGLLYSAYNFINHYYPIEIKTSFIHIGLTVIALFGIHMFLGVFDMTKKHIQRKMIGGEREINVLKEVTLTIMNNGFKGAHDIWIQMFWVNSVKIGLILTFYSAFKSVF